MVFVCLDWIDPLAHDRSDETLSRDHTMRLHTTNTTTPATERYRWRVEEVTLAGCGSNTRKASAACGMYRPGASVPASYVLLRKSSEEF